jgi:hypothetical protein
MVNGKGQKPRETRKFRRRILAVLIVLAILMLLMILRPSVIRKKHFKIYGAEIRTHGLDLSFPPSHTFPFFSMKNFPCSGYIFPVLEIML